MLTPGLQLAFWFVHGIKVVGRSAIRASHLPGIGVELSTRAVLVRGTD